jgi:hypothetical protein
MHIVIHHHRGINMLNHLIVEKLGCLVISFYFSGVSNVYYKFILSGQNNGLIVGVVTLITPQVWL